MPAALSSPNPGWSREYRLLEPVGSGSVGVVWRAELRCAAAFHRTIALKMLHAGAAPGRVERLREEARLLGRVRHRAIVGVLGLVDVGGRPALAMEYIEGADLERLLRLGAMPPATAVELAAEIAGALDAAWSTPDDSGRPLQLVHRDLSASNVRITPAGAVKVIDFGLAREAERVHEGTRAMARSPEAVHGHDGPAADVYALGLLLFEALLGRPFGAPAAHVEAHEARLREGLMALWESTGSEALVRLVGELLAWSPAHRPAAREVERRATALRRGLAGPCLRDWAERSLAALSKEAPTGTPPLETPTPAPLARAPRTRPWLLWTLIGAGLGLGLLGVAATGLIALAVLGGGAL